MRVGLFIRLSKSGNSNSKNLFLEKPHLIVGRIGCDVELPDSHVSKHHALLFQDMEGRLRVRDMDSRNGVFVDEKRIEEAILTPGASFVVGPFKIMVTSYEPGKTNGIVGNLKSDQPVVTQDTKASVVVTHKDSDAPEVVTSWPENFAAMPKERQKDFDHISGRSSKKGKG